MPPAGGRTTPPIFFPEKENGRCDRPKERRLHCMSSLEQPFCLRNGNACAQQSRVSIAIRFDLLLLSAVALPAYRQSPSISVYFGYTTVLHYSGQKRFFPANSSLHAEFFRKFGVTHRVLPFGRPIRPVKDHKNRPAQ